MELTASLDFFSMINSLIKDSTLHRDCCEHLRVFKVLPQETVFFQGSPSDAFFIVLEGSVRIIASTGVEKRVGKGGYFGELGIINDTSRSATVVNGNTVTHLAFLDKQTFQSIFDSKEMIDAIFLQKFKQIEKLPFLASWKNQQSKIQAFYSACFVIECTKGQQLLQHNQQQFDGSLIVLEGEFKMCRNARDPTGFLLGPAETLNEEQLLDPSALCQISAECNSAKARVLFIGNRELYDHIMTDEEAYVQFLVSIEKKQQAMLKKEDPASQKPASPSTSPPSQPIHSSRGQFRLKLHTCFEEQAKLQEQGMSNIYLLDRHTKFVPNNRDGIERGFEITFQADLFSNSNAIDEALDFEEDEEEVNRAHIGKLNNGSFNEYDDDESLRYTIPKIEDINDDDDYSDEDRDSLVVGARRVFRPLTEKSFSFCAPVDSSREIFIKGDRQIDPEVILQHTASLKKQLYSSSGLHRSKETSKLFVDSTTASDSDQEADQKKASYGKSALQGLKAKKAKLHSSSLSSSSHASRTTSVISSSGEAVNNDSTQYDFRKKSQLDLEQRSGKDETDEGEGNEQQQGKDGIQNRRKGRHIEHISLQSSQPPDMQKMDQKSDLKSHLQAYKELLVSKLQEQGGNKVTNNGLSVETRVENGTKRKEIKTEEIGSATFSKPSANAVEISRQRSYAEKSSPEVRSKQATASSPETMIGRIVQKVKNSGVVAASDNKDRSGVGSAHSQTAPTEKNSPLSYSVDHSSKGGDGALSGLQSLNSDRMQKPSSAGATKKLSGSSTNVSEKMRKQQKQMLDRLFAGSGKCFSSSETYSLTGLNGSSHGDLKKQSRSEAKYISTKDVYLSDQPSKNNPKDSPRNKFNNVTDSIRSEKAANGSSSVDTAAAAAAHKKNQIRESAIYGFETATMENSTTTNTTGSSSAATQITEPNMSNSSGSNNNKRASKKEQPKQQQQHPGSKVVDYYALSSHSGAVMKTEGDTSSSQNGSGFLDSYRCGQFEISLGSNNMRRKGTGGAGVPRIPNSFVASQTVFPKSKKKLSTEGNETVDESSPNSHNNPHISWSVNSISEDKLSSNALQSSSSRLLKSNTSQQEKQLMNFIFTRSKLLAAAETTRGEKKLQKQSSTGNTSVSSASMAKQYDSFRSAVGLLCKTMSGKVAGFMSKEEKSHAKISSNTSVSHSPFEARSSSNTHSPSKPASQQSQSKRNYTYIQLLGSSSQKQLEMQLGLTKSSRQSKSKEHSRLQPYLSAAVSQSDSMQMSPKQSSRKNSSNNPHFGGQPTAAANQENTSANSMNLNMSASYQHVLNKEQAITRRLTSPDIRLKTEDNTPLSRKERAAIQAKAEEESLQAMLKKYKEIQEKAKSHSNTRHSSSVDAVFSHFGGMAFPNRTFGGTTTPNPRGSSGNFVSVMNPSQTAPKFYDALLANLSHDGPIPQAPLMEQLQENRKSNGVSNIKKIIYSQSKEFAQSSHSLSPRKASNSQNSARI